ncbi:hypothetical protein LCGC14_1497170 [marine sediment metagenome]|uniref:Uncharacterized protein n=1 Tax=marine sediment metagenome TaxID=412755 RepID=A0A0F9LKS1_9ZZZZ
MLNNSHSQQRIPWFEAQRARLEYEAECRKHGLLPPLQALILSLDEDGKIISRLETLGGTFNNAPPC